MTQIEPVQSVFRPVRTPGKKGPETDEVLLLTNRAMREPFVTPMSAVVELQNASQRFFSIS